MNDRPSRIDGYHAHVYYSAESRPTAEALAKGVDENCTVELAGFFDGPAGPHPLANLQITFTPAEFASVVPWLMRNRNGLTVLIHPLSGDPLRDHDTDAAWLGTPVRLKPHGLRRTYRPELLPSA